MQTQVQRVYGACCMAVMISPPKSLKNDEGWILRVNTLPLYLVFQRCADPFSIPGSKSPRSEKERETRL
ncbi:hypothetical protein AOR01nite_16280 [Acetobacter orleanensis]|uniref:Uncharacterized protein n=1 Tax=Acetobacter orleanensis TaxID=104099 RepID=A0A4Y3TJH8_9PROT|nr:hypothetical protein Abol_011_070 [Acetobacter orleanensis JCM 7639]GEB83151.1 hypothetical protein AOR01nite_16280 [Acetobacter orleanensis]